MSRIFAVIAERRATKRAIVKRRESFAAATVTEKGMSPATARRRKIGPV